MWWFLAGLAAFQLYFVKELLAAFALFALAFAGIAVLITAAYMLQKGWEEGVARVARSSNPAVVVAKRGAAVVEDFARRPLRGTGSAHAR